MDQKTLQTTHSNKGYDWIHLPLEDQEALEWLKGSSCADTHIKMLITADDTRPRSHLDDYELFLNIRAANLNEDAEAEDMLALRMFAAKNVIITAAKMPLKAVDDMARKTAGRHGSASPFIFLADLTHKVIDRMEPVIERMVDQMDNFEVTMLEAPDLKLRTQILQLRLKVIAFRRYIAPQKEALTQLANEDSDIMDDALKHRLMNASDRTSKILEDLEAMRERLAVLFDQLTDQRAELMNRNMLILAIVAAIFLPLGLLTGLLGINVGGVPGAENPNAFWLVTAGIITLGVGASFFFRYLKMW